MSDAVRHPLFARFYAWLAPLEDRAGVAEHRRDLVAGLRGRVLELGVGTGLSFQHYPPEVEQLVAVEPEPTMRANAAKAAREVALDVVLVDGTADALPAPDASVDAAVVSQVLCSVPEPARALAELRRVLRPGGELRFYEHVLSPDEAGRRVQRPLDATSWPPTMGGCHLGRDTAATIVAAGFEVRELRRFRIGPTPAAPHILGVATAPS
ncbi:MAG: class I SAM-dependent methyltransferase [Solirubrobacteraceae bacterium]